jgi:hypothetical protein
LQPQALLLEADQVFSAKPKGHRGQEALPWAGGPRRQPGGLLYDHSGRVKVGFSLKENSGMVSQASETPAQYPRAHLSPAQWDMVGLQCDREDKWHGA